MTPNEIEERLNTVRRLLDAAETKLAPRDAELLIRYGHLLYRKGYITEALKAALQASMRPAPSPDLADSLGTLLTMLGDPGKGLPCFESAVAMAPDHCGYRYNLAMAERMCGYLERAEANLDRVIAARPLDGEAYHARSDLRRQTPDRNHISQLQRVLPRLAGHRAMYPVSFALAKELDDLGEYARSFDHLQKACRAYRASLRYDVASDVAVLEKLAETHRIEVIKRLQTAITSDEPIFVLGLPRSGTTLVERILAGHSAVATAGEIDTFQRLAVAAVEQRAGMHVGKLDFVDRLLDVDLGKAAAAYLREVRSRTGGAARLVDKFPMNYLYAGAIHAALPHARFVALRRNPMDSCYAMYKTLFAAAYPFTYDLEELGRYYVAWDRLMRHWEASLGPAWLSVSYESLVTRPDIVARQVVTHCGLTWEDACLRIHERSQAVMTASAVQVRQPINTRSVGRWRRHAEQLTPLLKVFEVHRIEV